MSIGQFELQEAIYTRLSTDNTLTSTLGAGVYDEVSQNQATPFVSMGYGTAIDYGTKDIDGGEFTVTFDIWSEYKGAKEE